MSKDNCNTTTGKEMTHSFSIAAAAAAASDSCCYLKKKKKKKTGKKWSGGWGVLRSFKEADV